MLFVNELKIHRAKRQLSQEDLAHLVGVRRETIVNLEKGKYNPSLLLAMQIAVVFQVKVDDLFKLIDVKQEKK